MGVGSVGVARIQSSWDSSLTGTIKVTTRRATTARDLARDLALQHPELRTTEDQALLALRRSRPGLEGSDRIRGGESFEIDLNHGLADRLGDGALEFHKSVDQQAGRVVDSFEKSKKGVEDWWTGKRTGTTMSAANMADWTTTDKKKVAEAIGELTKEPNKPLAERAGEKAFSMLVDKLDDVIAPAAKTPLALMKKAAEEGPKVLHSSLQEARFANHVADLREYVSSPEMKAQFPDGITVNELHDRLNDHQYLGDGPSARLAQNSAKPEKLAAVVMVYMAAFESEGRVRLR
ncbi:MAG TPA: hypothetical protein VMT16_13080 [Thermoanaerobaculia bacterium]|nr:hypothetical protein [Thermoanaerobaculia bacterium]